MRHVAALLALAVLAAGCASIPLPGVGSGVPQTCAERLTEPSCSEGRSCRWINDAKRGDGTYATAHCANSSETE
jgi:hypothetical protein